VPFFTSRRTVEQAFDIDWNRCNQARFRSLINKADDGDNSALDELEEVRQVLLDHALDVYAVYSFYCATERCADAFMLGKRGFDQMVKAMGIVDEASKYAQMQDIESLWATTNAEEKGTKRSAEQRKLDELNADSALMRFEFLQILVRIAISKYVLEGEEKDVSVAVQRLITADLLPNMSEEARYDAETFRRSKLYNREVNEVLEKWAPQLKMVFDDNAQELSEEAEFAARVNRKKGEFNNATLSHPEWLAFLKTFDFLLEGQGVRVGYIETEVAVSKDMAVPVAGDGVTKDMATLIFCWSQSFVTDEMKRRDKMLCLSYVDFIEALARLASFKMLPTSEQLRLTNSASCAHFFEQAASGMLDPGVRDVKEQLYLRRPEEGDQLADYLNTFISWMLEKIGFAEDGEGNFTPPEHIAERAALIEKKKKKNKSVLDDENKS